MTMMHPARRGFLAGTGALGLGLIAGCTEQRETSEAASAKPYEGILGVQLYTVRDLFEKDAKATLEAVAQIGYKDVETAGLFKHKAEDVRAIIDDLGLTSRSGHFRLPALKEGLEADMEAAKILGQDRLYLGWIPEEERTPDGYRALADLFNERGAVAKQQGLKLGYHNHEFEFIEQDGENGYDILLERTDPELVDMEIDFFWVADANVDPLTLFEKAPGRFSSCHIKDRSKDGEMVSVGSGTIDFASILENSEQAGLTRFYVEHDNPEEPLASIAQSFANLVG
jgi:sugar phosphate isomerase/epimerase